MEWLKSLYEFLGSQYPRLSILIAAALGAVLFGGGWWLIGKQYERDSAKIPTSASASVQPALPVLSPVQERLLELLAKYQRQFAVTKLVVLRKQGTLFFDDDPHKGTDVSLIRDLYGSDKATEDVRFEELMETMPPEYLRFFPEMRLDSPFVVGVTEAGMRYLQSRR